MPAKCVSCAMCQCTFGAAPSALNVLPTNRVLCGGLPAGSIMDFAPIVNIVPFGMCSSVANPTVAAATAAALGVLTPMPCVPVTTPWISSSPTVMIGAGLALNMGDKTMCTWGGTITVIAPGQFTVW